MNDISLRSYNMYTVDRLNGAGVTFFIARNESILVSSATMVIENVQLESARNAANYYYFIIKRPDNTVHQWKKFKVMEYLFSKYYLDCSTAGDVINNLELLSPGFTLRDQCLYWFRKKHNLAKKQLHIDYVMLKVHLL